MKSNLLIYVACLLCLNAFSQVPNIEWQKSFGGNIHEEAFNIQQTTDNGYIVLGYTNSTNGSVITGHPGGYDIWIAKLSSIGNIVWQRTLGGSQHDWAYNIQQTSDGGYILAGSTDSNNGDVTGNNGNLDYWIVRLNSVGDIIWQKNYGGSDHDYARSIKQTLDGGFIVVGGTSSNNGDVSGNHNALSDYWILKLNSSGEIIWKKCLGGTSHDAAYDIQITSDGGYIITGVSSSLDGNVTGNHGGGSRDFWVVKTNATGDIIWQKSLGGTSEDFSHNIQQTTDNGFIVTGYSSSNNSDVTGNHGNYDCWIVKLNATGDIIWQKSLGGTNIDSAYSTKQTTDGGYIVAGYSSSNDGDVSGNHGNNDMWIIKLNNSGDIVWQKTLGGSADDRAFSIIQTIDGGYVVAGVSWSNDGDLINNQGYGDVWIVKLSPENLSISEHDASKFSIYPNPTNNYIKIQNKENSTANFDYKIIDLIGRIIKIGKSKFNEQINIESLTNGNYIIQVETENGKKTTKKLIKN
ncbi:Por secretion system C-terminal sorting domain-containing protein [Flavobacterium swingsii]|uniref:Por secretion system C-terminal sorting domain-containing protein n=1 Tax=Flavobacterium swingsii TaxID=498292 RepID=A0A1I0V7Y1_9FLAO|nr:T9SS type A sorting domain-containing protein [Flavobacterium swingsii]SFA72388.1 Por secretion system C-terminal sorting domain-containing protein [Flavobacterium swingsii]